MLTARAVAAYGQAGATAAPAVIAASKTEKGIRAQLDDTAQMLGLWLPVVPAAEGALLTALQTYDAVLVSGLGVICRARTEGDVAALCLLAEKACVCFLHTQACGEKALLTVFDTLLMRRIYLTKYAKRIGG